MTEHHETTARALLSLAATRTAYARAQVTATSEDAAKDAALAEYLAAVEAVEQIADRRVVRFDRAQAIERLRVLAGVSPDDLRAEASKSGDRADALLAEVLCKLERERQRLRRDSQRPFWARTAFWNRHGFRVAAADTMEEDPGWRDGHYGTLHVPPLDREDLRARGFDVQRDPRYRHIDAWRVLRSRGGDIRETVSEDHPTEQDAWEFANAFVLGTQDPPPRDTIHDSEDPPVEQAE